MYVLRNECSLSFRKSFCGMGVIGVGGEGSGGGSGGARRRDVGGYLGWVLRVLGFLGALIDRL